MSIRQRRWLRAALWALVLLWMAVIFRFSSQTAAASSETSGGVIRWLLVRFDRGFPDLSPEDQALRIEGLSFIVRKLAHGCLFAVLGVLTLSACLVDLPPRRAYPAALTVAAFRGVLDEVHQLFVPGRSCELRDMAIDALGAAIGAGALLVLVLLFRKKRRS